MKKRVIILGATGSVGRDTLEIIRQNPNDFEIAGLACDSNCEQLVKYVVEFDVCCVCIGSKSSAQEFLTQLSIIDPKKAGSVNVKVGCDGMIEFVSLKNIDLVVNCLSGESGIKATKKAITNGINIALANKEALVSKGIEIVKLAKKHNVSILPIDSEICAIYQCLRGLGVDETGQISYEEIRNNVEKIVLTCSGGPFFGKTCKELENVTLEEALNHPTWSNMGKKITINCATLMNKGYEIIETAVLFGIDPTNIEVVIHPQSLVHAIVYFKDGNVLMHAATTDMKIPISYCLYYPEVKKNTFPKLNLVDVKKLEFYEPDTKTFSNLTAAYNALRAGTTQKLLIENETRVQKFLNSEVKFSELFIPL